MMSSSSVSSSNHRLHGLEDSHSNSLSAQQRKSVWNTFTSIPQQISSNHSNHGNCNVNNSSFSLSNDSKTPKIIRMIPIHIIVVLHGMDIIIRIII